MSIKEVIDRAAAVGNWEFYEFMQHTKYIRLAGTEGMKCPLSAVTGRELHDFTRAGLDLGLTLRHARMVALAADGHWLKTGIDSAENDRGQLIRAYMLKAFNLQEQP